MNESSDPVFLDIKYLSPDDLRQLSGIEPAGDRLKVFEEMRVLSFVPSAALNP